MLLDHGADVNYVGKSGSTLAIAAANGNFKLVKLLVERGADVNRRAGEEDTTALNGAIISKAGIEIITYLLDNGADVNVRTPQTAPIYDVCYTGDVEILRLLIERGVELNISVGNGWTPLHAAYQNAELVRVLLDAGAEIDKIHKESGVSALFLAALGDHEKTVRVMLQYNADINLRSHPVAYHQMDGYTALSSAVLSDRVDNARLLLEAGADLDIKHDDGTFILQDVKGEEMMRTVMEFRPDLTLEDEQGRTVLHSLVFSLPLTKILVHGGCNIDRTDKNGYTPLLGATALSRVEVMRFLIKRGANVNASSAYGSPLNLACFNTSLEAVKALVEAGADVDKGWNTHILSLLMG
ncbi:hypothetical protein SLS58_007100 [Diplodia intermedia]|uniref:Uncharacterized protein n=1 Tax=Diplodia intermedia TaxID=856260 RepID=A0ABR3TL36_9PEZI